MSPQNHVVISWPLKLPSEVHWNQDSTILVPPLRQEGHLWIGSGCPPAIYTQKENQWNIFPSHDPGVRMDEILAKRLMEILMVTQGSCKLPVHFMILHGYEKLVLLGFSKSHLKHMLVKIGSFPQVSGLKKTKIFENNTWYILQYLKTEW